VAALRGPERFVFRCDLARKEGGVGVDVDGLTHNAHNAIDVHLHESLLVGDGTDLIVNPETHAFAVIVGEGHGVGEHVVELGN